MFMYNKGTPGCWQLAKFATNFTAMVIHMPYSITWSYLPPGNGDIPAFTSAKPVLNLVTMDGCKANKLT